MQANDCNLTYEQKIILKKLNQWLGERKITPEVNIHPIRERLSIIFTARPRVEDAIWEFLDNTINLRTINTFVACGFFQELSQENYLIEKSHLQNAIDDNFGESLREKPLILNQEQWDFLILLKDAIYGKYLNPKSKSETGFYIRPVQEGEKIIGFDGFKEIFINAHRKALAISLKNFLHLESEGYLKKARNGHYYIIATKLLPTVEDYLTQNDRTRAIPTTSAFRLPDTSTQFQCDIFTVMPFRDELNPVYFDHIKPLVKELEYEIKRGDDTFSKHDIITEVWSLINNSKLIIADCTGKNANVFYELGLAHAIDKPVIIITQNEEDIPFDIRQRRYIKYEFTPRGMKQFEDDLRKAIQSILGG